MKRIVLISDTHGRHDSLEIPRCDFLIHAGDYSRRGSAEEARLFLEWFDRQPATHKVFVSGNHDFFSERAKEAMAELVARYDVHHLVDETVELDSLKIHGSPVTPYFRGMAWNRSLGDGMRAHYSKIPEGLDLLITHSPPRGTLDRTFFGAHVGCEVLREIVELREPKLHVFGHIHEAAGEARIGKTRFINAATSRLVLGIRAPHVVEL